MNTNFTIGQVVMFGRPNGEKTRGKIVDINMKSVTVITTEDRGKTKAGVKWRVAPSLVTPVDASSDLPSTSSKPATASAVDWYIKNAVSKYPVIGAGWVNLRSAELEKIVRDAYAAGQRDYRNALVGN